MSIFVETAIESVRSNSSGGTRSLKDYLLLIERIEQEKEVMQAHARAHELAKRQGVEPISNIENLPGDPSPEEDSVDEFLSWIYSIRQQDKDRSALE